MGNDAADVNRLARRLLAATPPGPRGGRLYPAATRLGDPSLRASLYWLLHRPGERPVPDRLRRALWAWANVEPVVVEVPPGSAIFGQIGLLNTGQVVAVLVLEPAEWDRHSIECAACACRTPRWSPTQKYCPAHSWATPEGRRYQRAHR